jgi:hypothetical protein
MNRGATLASALPLPLRGDGGANESCEKKKQLLWAEWLQKEVLEPVPHRHVVLTMRASCRDLPKAARASARPLSQSAAEALAEYMRIRVGPDTRPGIVVSIATSGDLLQWHPHGKILVTDGAFSDDGAFHTRETWDADAVMKLFRERLLARLIERHAISEELARKLLAWRHPGFSAHVGEAIPFEDKKAVADVACYIVRAPLSLKKLVYLDGQKAVLYRSRMNPFLGRNFEAMDPLEWLARLADHIPDTGKHRTHFYGFYASRVRASRREKEGSELPAEPAPTKRRCPPSWAAAHQQGVPGGPARLQRLRRSAQDRGLHHRRDLDCSHSRPFGPEPAGTGEATAERGGGPGAGGRRGAGAPGQLRTATFDPDACPQGRLCLRQRRHGDSEEDRRVLWGS